MTSQARIDANRQNALLSTGPRTREGKLNSARNATTHGFFARLFPIDDPAYQDLLAGLYQTLQPADQLQQILVEQIAIAYLRLGRLYEQELSDRTPPDESRADNKSEIPPFPFPLPASLFPQSSAATTRLTPQLGLRS